MTDATLDPVAAQALFDQVVEDYLKPELERRIGEGHLAAGTEVYRFQVLFPDKCEPEVRINDEVGGIVMGKAARAIEEGETVFAEDVAGIEGYQPRPGDAGIPHLTALSDKRGWTLVFEFGGGSPKRSDYLSVAGEFLETARQALMEKRPRVFVDNAFSACELLAKAELLSTHPTAELVLGRKRHPAVSTPYHAWAKLGNTDNRFPRALRQLEGLRGPARYLDKSFTLPEASAQEILDVLDAMQEHVAKVVDGKRAGLEEDRVMMIAKRPLRAGQFVRSEDVTIYPLSKKTTSGPEARVGCPVEPSDEDS